MKTGKKIYYWDTNVFLAWITYKPKTVTVDVLDGIEEIAKLVNENKAVLITSVMTDTEIVRTKLPPAAREKWDLVLKRPNIKMISQDRKISSRSNEINGCLMDDGKQISIPDSVHLATAMIYKADEFHTLDGSGKRRPGLLALSGHECLGGLKICLPKPSSPQGNLYTGIPPLGESKQP